MQRRDQPVSAKEFSEKDEFIQRARDILGEIQDNLLTRATEFRNSNITTCDSLDAFHAHWAGENPGWLYTPWAGSREQEEMLSKQHKITIRCIPIPEAGLPVELNAVGQECIITGKATPVRAIWGRSY